MERETLPLDPRRAASLARRLRRHGTVTLLVRGGHLDFGDLIPTRLPEGARVTVSVGADGAPVATLTHVYVRERRAQGEAEAT